MNQYIIYTLDGKVVQALQGTSLDNFNNCFVVLNGADTVAILPLAGFVVVKA